MRTFTTTSVRTHTFTEGWGVDVIAIHEGETEDGHISDEVVALDTVVVPITEALAREVGGVWCVPLSERTYCPIVNFLAEPDESAQYGARWFATEAEAVAYAGEVDRFAERAGLTG